MLGKGGSVAVRACHMHIEAAALLPCTVHVQALASERVEGAQRDYQIMELQVGQVGQVHPCLLGPS
jgi:hypothetical protein